MDELYVLDRDRKQVLVIDNYISLIWAERYNDEGDFVLELPTLYLNNQNLKAGHYLVTKDTERFMIIQSIKPEFDAESGSKLVVTGPSGESILRWRTIEKPLFLDDLPIPYVIDSLISNNLMGPTNVKRAITHIELGWTPLSYVTFITDYIEVATLYDIITKICKSDGLGFKMTFVPESRNFKFLLYRGKDRSYHQNDNPHVEFSDEFDNVNSSSYYISIEGVANVAVVVTEDEKPELQVVPVYLGAEPEGVFRREAVVNGNDIRRTVSGKPDLTDEEILSVITQRGHDHIIESIPVGIFDGDVDIHGSFKYGRDFFMGDLVQCILNGLTTRARVTEIVYSNSESGKTAYATFNFNVDQ